MESELLERVWNRVDALMSDPMDGERAFDSKILFALRDLVEVVGDLQNQIRGLERQKES